MSPAASGESPGGRPLLRRTQFLNLGARLNLARFRRKLLASAKRFDAAGSGKLTPTEFCAGLAGANIVVSKHEFDQLAGILESSGDGLVDIGLLTQLLDQLSATSARERERSERHASEMMTNSNGGETLAFLMPIRKDAREQGLWVVANSPPGIRRERRAGIVTPWAERVGLKLAGTTATEASQRSWRESRKHGEQADYRWPALPLQRKPPKPYRIPRSASPRARPWSPRAEAVTWRARQQHPPSSSKLQQQQQPAQPPDRGRPLSRTDAARVARDAERAARAAASVQLEKQQLHTTRAVSPYSVTLLNKRQRRPRTASAAVRPRSSLPTAQADSVRYPGDGRLSARLASPIGIYLPSSCGPIDV